MENFRKSVIDEELLDESIIDRVKSFFTKEAAGEYGDLPDLLKD